MSLLGLLNTGLIGTHVGQAGTQVAATNLTNVATEGYARRQASVRPELGMSQSTARRVVEPFVERRLLSARSAYGEASALTLALAPLDNIFAEGEGSLGTALDNFQASLMEFSSRPNDMAVREQVLARAGHVASAFNTVAAGLKQARSDANQRVSGGVDEVNQRLRQVASLTAQIGRTEVGGGDAGDLRDRRDVLVREIAERVPVTVIEQDNGSSFSLMLAGSQQLVSQDGKVHELSTTTDSAGNVRVTKVTAGQAIDVTNLLSSGSLGGQLKALDGPLKQIESKVNQLAYDFQSQYNQVQTAGVALDGSSGPSLFEPLTSVTDAASLISVSSDIAGRPELLAAASDALALPSDNSNALDFVKLTVAPIALGGMTVTEALASLTGSAGMAVQTATQAESFASGALEQVAALRDGVSGVSSDEEMVAMMRYQRTYEASLHIIQVADQMMQALMDLRR